MTAQQVPVQGFNVPPAAPGTTQHSREGAPTPNLASAPAVPGVPEHATVTTSNPTQPITPGLDPHLTALLQQVAQQANNGQPVVPPVVPPVPPAPTEISPGGLNDLKPGDIDDPQVRALGELLIGSVPNLDLNRAIGKAIEYGDPGLVDAAYLKDIGGDKAAALLNVAQQIVMAVDAKSKATIQQVYTDAGGQAQWEAAVALFNKNAPKHIKEVAQELLNSSQFSKIQTGAKFVTEYAKQQGGLSSTPDFLTPSGYQGDSSQALDKSSFQQELRKLAPEHQNPNYVQERNELFRRRQLGKNLGR